jgi:hypothetical protein
MRGRPAELLTAFVGSLLALALAFGVNVTDDQAAAILAVVSLIPAVVTAYVSHTR